MGSRRWELSGRQRAAIQGVPWDWHAAHLLVIGQSGHLAHEQRGEQQPERQEQAPQPVDQAPLRQQRLTPASTAGGDGPTTE